MPRGGRQRGQEGDGTDKNVLRVGGANVDDGGGGSEKGGKDTQTLYGGMAAWSSL